MKLIRRADGKTVLVAKKEEIQELVKKAKWGKEDVVNPAEKGKYDGKSKKELESMLSSAKKRQESYKDSHDGKADPELTGKIKELNFAIRAKSGWGNVN